MENEIQGVELEICGIPINSYAKCDHALKIKNSNGFIEVVLCNIPENAGMGKCQLGTGKKYKLNPPTVEKTYEQLSNKLCEIRKGFL